MNPKRILVMCSMIALIVSCSKKNDEAPPPAPPENKQVKAIKDYLTQTPELGTFASSFAKVSIAETDLQQGLTVFAPNNTAITAYDPNARVYAAELTEAEIKDHIVKGVFKKADLEDGDELTTLSGKKLIIVIDGDVIWINGARLLTNKEDSAAVVFGINDVLCKKPGTVNITVYDALQWNTTDTLGKPAAEAMVQLMGEQQNYDGNTTATGKITFTGVREGTYKLYAYKADKTNYVDPEYTANAMIAYKVIGIFQNEQQINATPHLNGTAAGDFIIADINGDGVINKNDKTDVPYTTITVRPNKTVEAKLFLGYLVNHIYFPFKTKADAQAVLDNVYNLLGAWQQMQYVLDGVITDDANCDGLSNWCAIDNYEYNPSNTIITNYWQSGFNMISSLNRVLINLPALNLSAGESDPIVGQTRALRAYINMQLAIYFAGIPIHEGVTLANNLSRAAFLDNIAFVKAELTQALPKLPAKWTGSDRFRIGANAVKILLAREAFITENDYRIKDFTAEVIQSGSYSLVNKSQIFADNNNAEIVWGLETTIQPQYNAFFADTITHNYSPIIRYSEVLLLNSEAQVKLFNMDLTGVNGVRARRGVAPIATASQTEAMEAIQQTWKTEHYREGLRLIKLYKWNKLFTAAPALNTYKRWLPIPQVVLAKYPNMYQNVGY